MILYVVYYRGKFIAHYHTRYEAEQFVGNCRLCFCYSDCDAGIFEIKEEHV